MTGFGTLVRFMLHRERVRIPVYALVLVALVASTAGQSEELYATAAERAEYAATVAGNAGLVAMVGEPYDVTTVGGDVAWQWGVFGAVAAALMAMFIVGRHTRAEEQSGRSELVGAGVVGRLAPTAAALCVAAVASVAAGGATALALAGIGQPAAGSVALGASIAAAGLLFAALTAVAAQLAQGTGGTYGLTSAALGAAYALRAAGDVGDGTLSWLSPLGWSQATRPFAGERWWPLALLVAAAAALAATALVLRGRRDDGAGVLVDRPGPPHAAPALARPAGLALRLQRGALAGWTTGLFLGGLSIGLTAQDADAILGDSEEVDELFARAAGSLVDNYLAVSLLSMALVGSGFAIQAILRMRAEERDGRLEPLLATALARPRWMAGHVAVSAAGTVVLLAACGLGAGIAEAANTGDLGRVPVLVGSALALAPAVWVLAGVAAVLYGFAPRVAPAAWAALAACYLVGFLGPLLGLPAWVQDVSPFTHVPLLPAADVAAGPLLALTAVAAALVAAGLAGFRRRDVPVA